MKAKKNNVINIKQIEGAVIKYFSSRDFHQLNMREFAKEAGVSLGTIYKHFESKEALMFTFLDLWLGDLTDKIIDHLQGMEGIKERIRKIFWVQLDYYDRHPDIGKIIFITVPLQTWMYHKTYEQKKMIQILMGVLKQGQKDGVLNSDVSTVQLMDFIFAVVRRLVTVWIYRGQKGSLKDQANSSFDMLWRAISRPPGI